MSLTITLNPSHDAQYHDNAPTTNFGSNTWLRVGNNTWDSETSRSAVRFDLSSYYGMRVLVATLRIHVYLHQDDTNPKHDIYVADGTWDESTVTWNTQPGSTGSAFSSTYWGGTGYKEFDVKTQVQNWLNGVIGIHGFIFKTNNESGDNRTLMHAKENGSNKPELVLELEHFGRAGII